ncbi:hypothetical protein AXF42_Ash000214 [Apostasia shenzhenica]|uniref:Folate receptor-like domain-containing protein n=1 Tax=Apostasia shenzhenica TaxID=1088818 RepID=A0A2I0AFQ7_9ASPA|nr:hypothetical protein AXF42_Ash000214 [Apostasia shenzhenica]
MCRSRMAGEIWGCLLFFVVVLIPTSAGQSSGLCISPGGRFPSFSFEGKPPKKVAKGSRDLALCRVFRESTCCDVSQTYPALLSIRRLASSGEGSEDCLHLWELLECSICDPRVGIQPGLPVICATFCNMILQACSNAYFSIDLKNQVLSPCGLSDIVCGRASEWASNGTELCRLAGFSVQEDLVGNQGADDPFCFGGKPSLESIAASWKGSKSGFSARSQSSQVCDDFVQWFKKMPVGQKVGWLFGGMVLAAGLLFVRKRKRYSRRQKQATALRTARRIEGRLHQSSTIRR